MESKLEKLAALKNLLSDKPIKDKDPSKKPKATKESKESKQNTAEVSRATKASSGKKEKSNDKESKPSQRIKDNQESIEFNRKWNDFKNKEKLDLKKGQFQQEEINTILSSICEYAYENNLKPDDIISLVTEKQKRSDKSLWNSISEKLPNRSVQSVHNFCHRALNPNNHKGRWTEDEISTLLNLYKVHGEKWTLIGEEIGRTANNVKDKFKEVGGLNYSQRQKTWTLKHTLKLVKYIGEELEKPLLKIAYKFTSKMDDLYEVQEIKPDGLDGSEYADLRTVEDYYKILKISKNMEDETSVIIINNVLKIILNLDALESVIFSDKKQEISWTTISTKLQYYSYDDCKNQYGKILNYFNLTRKHQIKQDLKLMKNLIKYDYDELDEVNFQLIKNDRSAEENKSKLQEYLKFNDIYGVQSFKQIIKRVYSNLEKEYIEIVNKGLDPEANAKSEIKKRINLKEEYNKFLSRKRKRAGL